MHNSKTICLNMIVKNESHIILDTLNNLCLYFNFDYWVIVDTGSTDNTKQIISDFFNHKNIKGELHDTPWKNFGFNRSDALSKAFNKTDYLLIFDADDQIIGDLKLPDNLNLDGYHLKFGNNFSYVRLLLINNRLQWQFIGVLHEYINCMNLNYNCKFDNINGNYYLISGKSGARSNNPNKYLDDAKILENAYYEAKNNNDDIMVRYSFYCAQSYKDAGYTLKSIEWYKKRIEYAGWNQEVYYSYITIGLLYEKINNIEAAFYYWILSYNADPERCEGIYFVIKHCREKAMFNLAFSYYKLIENNKYRNLLDKLFVTEDIYKFLIDYEFTVMASYVNQHKLAIKSFHNLFKYFDADIFLKENIINNLHFYTNFIDYSVDNLKFFYDFIKFIKNIYLKKGSLSTSIIDVSNTIINNFKPFLSFYDSSKISFINNYINKINKNNNYSHEIILTITSCKRFDLFQKTINSFINNCTDFNKISYFFCVDDNSSDEDRIQMKKLYPFFNFYFKNYNEKGHRQSMNIIWNKLNFIKPKFYLHLEDDWLFIKKQKFISKSISFLDKFKSSNIHQILFNKNYAEIIDHFNLIGGKFIDKNIKLHIKDEKNLNGNNCAYWPHFSFRPSIIRTDIILQLGNFDSPNNFFEMDFANKYFNSGFFSSFFNDVNTIHIGKLTHETNSNIANAYHLNNTKQFNDPNNNNNNSNFFFIKNFLINDIHNNFYINYLLENHSYYYNDSDINNNKSFFIVNLVKRLDRKNYITDLLYNNKFFNIDFHFFKAIDGYILKPTETIFKLFQNNDFNYRCGFIGCALSHLIIWNKLYHDNINNFYTIIEDDITLANDFYLKYNIILNDIKNIDFDIVFLGYHMFNNNRESTKNIYMIDSDNIIIDKMNIHNYFIGGTFGYIISKSGVNKMFKFIFENGIKHGIDYLFKINNELICFESKPHIIFSDWVDDLQSNIDSDIQKNNKSIDFSINNFVKLFDNTYSFFNGLDHSGDDIDFISNKNLSELFNISDLNPDCVAFNTLGFLKKFVNPLKLVETPWIHKNNNQGIFIKKNFLNSFSDKTLNNNKIFIKMLCDWCSSKQLCDEWNRMSKGNYQWNNIEITWTNDTKLIDYYVVINKTDQYFNPSRTIVFQMEPWCDDPNATWGVKTWGEWAIPDENKFLHVRSHKKFYNNCFWQLSTSYNQFKNNSVDLTKKYNWISSICSSKYFDPGHIKRIDFIKFIESKNDPIVKIDIYNHDNFHNFFGYKGPLPNNIKDFGIIPYKYYFMCENNDEKNFITEKIWEPLLTETLCFYWGCSNISDHINPLAFVYLDMNDFQKSFDIIKDAISNDLWSKRINIIREEKQKVLDYFNFFPTLERVLFNDLLLPSFNIDNNLIYFHKYFYNYFDNILINNTKKILDNNVIFIHSCFIDNLDILNYLLKYITKYIQYFDKIFIINIGKILTSNLLNDNFINKINDKLIIFNYSNDISLFEIPTINILSIYSKFNPDANILYLHTKGISYNINNNNFNYILDWIHLMLYFLVDNIQDCIKILNDNTFKTIGCNFNLNPHPHYSGNFWWAKANYIKHLNHFKLIHKHDAEWWLLNDNSFKIDNHFICFNSNINHYQNLYPKNLYLNLLFNFNSYRELKLIYNIKKYESSAWLGHLEFAIWLVKRFNQIFSIKTIVELGVDFGHSTFSFISPNIGTVYSIDCFEGDIHTGYRDTYQIFLNKFKKLLDSGLLINNNLVIIKNYFDNVFSDFDNLIKSPIDILHIDGLHTYDAVKNDFNKWITKCHDNSIIIMHDVISFPNTVGKFFSEINNNIFFKTLVKHSAGLGIVSKNKNFIDIINNEWISKLIFTNSNQLIHENYYLFINQ